MNSRDIYQKVGKRMAQDGYINNPFAIPTAKEEKGEVIASMNEAILEYSYEKLCNLKMTNQIVMDLGVILDAIDSQLPQEEKEEFFSHYVHCMLNVYNTLEDKGILWSPEETEEPQEYPKFEKEGTYLEFLKTATTSQNKENALWLNHYLSTQYSRQPVKNNTK